MKNLVTSLMTTEMISIKIKSQNSGSNNKFYNQWGIEKEPKKKIAIKSDGCEGCQHIGTELLGEGGWYNYARFILKCTPVGFI